MAQKKISLASDNWAPAHPKIMQAIVDANVGDTPSYGSDPWTKEAEKLIQEAFHTKCRVFFLPTGTGGNVFSLKMACKRHESIICSDIAHIHYQESGAAESLIGCKLLTVPHKDGKVIPSVLQKKLKLEKAFGKHSTSPRILSITQPTEVGTVYNLEELRALSKLCKEENLIFHMDGSRLYNAIASLGVSFQDLIHAANVDVLSLGGTKNGLIGAEAVLIFNPELEEGSDYLQKQTLQLLSKMRYLSAQFLPFFKEGLWKSLALHANQKAKEIASLIEKIPNLKISYKVETNQIFFTAPPSWIPLIQEKIHCYPWDQEKGEVRFIASWNTGSEEVLALKAILSEIAETPL